MMRLPAFRYLAPTTVQEATRVLAEAGPNGMPVGGGTDLYPNMKRLQVRPSVVVGLRDIHEINEVRQTDDGLSIGAGVTLTQLASHSLIQKEYTPIADGIRTISTPLLRNMGTLGGNLCLDTRCHFLNQTGFWRQALGSCMKAEGDICVVAPGSHKCWAIASSDLPPLLIALGATIRVVGAKAERTLPLAEFYRDDGIDYLAKKPDEILAEVMVPALNGTRAGYLKIRRRGTFDFPVLGVAASLDLNANGTCEAARVVLGAVTPRPLDAPEARMLVGERITPELIRVVAETMRRRAKPLHLADYTHSYRKQMVAVYVRRLLEQLTKDIHA